MWLIQLSLIVRIYNCTLRMLADSIYRKNYDEYT